MYVTLLAGMASCKKAFQGPIVVKEEPLARVYNQYIYPSDLESLMSGMPSAEDSLERLHHLIDLWIKKKLLLNKSYKFLPDELQEIEARVKDYRESLVTHLYETKLLEKMLDTLVTDTEIQAFFESHRDNFKLKKSIISGRYLIINKDARHLDSVKLWFKNDDEYARQQLSKYVLEYMADAQLNPQWMDIEELAIKLKIRNSNPQKYFTENKNIQKNDMHNLFLFSGEDIVSKGDMAPIGYAANDIRSIIIKDRKNEYINKIKNKIYEEALQNNDFEIYKNPSP